MSISNQQKQGGHQLSQNVPADSFDQHEDQGLQPGQKPPRNVLIKQNTIDGREVFQKLMVGNNNDYVLIQRDEL